MTVAAAAAATALPSLWSGLLRRWARSPSTPAIEPESATARAEAITRLKERVRRYEATQPSYADDLRTALAQLERLDRAG